MKLFQFWLMGLAAVCYGVNDLNVAKKSWRGCHSIVRKGKAKNKLNANIALNGGYKYSSCTMCKGGKVGSVFEMSIDHKINNTPACLELEIRSSAIDILNPKSNQSILDPKHISFGIGINDANLTAVRREDPLDSKLILESSGYGSERLNTGAKVSNSLLLEYNDQVELNGILRRPIIAKFSTGLAPSALLPIDALSFTTIKLETKCSMCDYGISFGVLNGELNQYFFGHSVNFRDQHFVAKCGLTKNDDQEIFWSQFELEKYGLLYKLYSSINHTGDTGLNEISVSVPLQNKTSVRAGVTREYGTSYTKYTAHCGVRMTVPLVASSTEYIYNVDVEQDIEQNLDITEPVSCCIH